MVKNVLEGYWYRKYSERGIIMKTDSKLYELRKKI